MLIDCTVLKAETETCMRLLGVEKIDQLGPKHVSHSLPKLKQKLIALRSILVPWREMSMMGLRD